MRAISKQYALVTFLALAFSAACDDGGDPNDAPDGSTPRDGSVNGNDAGNGSDASTGNGSDASTGNDASAGNDASMQDAAVAMDSSVAHDASVPPNVANVTLENQMLALVNAQRAMGATCGNTVYPPAPLLTMNATLTTAARAHTYDMVNRDFFAHTNPDGKTPGDRITALGYDWNTYGENITAGHATAASAFQSWMNSPGHCANIMNPNFEELGVGVDMNTWTQVFGRRF